jgi:translocation and assembly module TamB
MTTRLRRWLRILSFVAAVFVGLLFLALAATQTAWFRDWLRRYVVREADQYLNGHLAIRRLDGNLFTGIEIEGVELTQDRVTVFAARNIGLRYNLIELLSSGATIDAIRIDEPSLRLERTPSGWNVARLVKEQASEADREGPASPLTIADIGISNGTIAIVDETGPAGTLPKKIERLDLQGRFDYRPVDFNIQIGHLSLRTTGPDLALNDLSGRLVVNEDDITIQALAVRTAESSVSLRGSVHAYLDTPTLDLTLTSDKFTPREFGGFVPALADIRLQPAFDLKAQGALSGLATELAIRSDAGGATARLVADVEGPERGVKGEARLEGLDLSRIQASLPPSGITAEAQVDLALDAADEVDGRAHVRVGPTEIRGYRVDSLDARATIRKSRMSVDAVADAYGAHATAAGDVVAPLKGRALTGHLEGRIAGLDLRRLPRALDVPRLDTRVAASYDVALEARGPSGTIVFDPSTIEGATIDAGTRVSGTLYGQEPTFAATGAVRGVDPQRVARALRQPALADDPRLRGRVDLTVDAQGRGRTLKTLELTGKVGVPEGTIAGGEIRDVVLDARLTRGAAEGTLTATFAQLDPAVAAGRPDLAGAVTGTLDGAFAVPDVTAIALPAASGRAQLTLAPSRIGEQTIDRGVLSASLAGGVADVASLDVSGPLAQITAKGPVSLTREGASNLHYEVIAADLAPAAALGGAKDVSGAGRVEGTLTGNLAELHTAGDLSLSNVGYGTTARAVEAKGHYDVALPELDAMRVRATASLRGAMVEAAGQSLREVTADVQYADRQAGFGVNVEDTASRALDADGRVTLPPAGQRDPIDLRLDRLTLAAGDTSWALTAPARLVYGADRLDVDRLALASGPQRIEVAGSLALGADARSVPADHPLKFTLTDVDLAAVDRLAQTGRGLAGTLNATGTASGSLDAPIAEVKAAVRDGAVGDFRYASLDASATHDAQAARVEARLERGAEWLTLKGTLPPAPVLRDEARRNTAPIDVQLQSSTIDLAVAQAFTTAVKDVTGTLDANVHATGTLARPVLDGSVKVANGAFALTDGTPFTGIGADIGLSADRIDVRQLEAVDREGHRLTGSGGAGLSLGERQLGTVDVRLTGEDFRVLDGDFGRLALDLNLGVRGAVNALRADGTIKVRSGRIEVDKVLAQVRPPEEPLEVAPAPAAPKPTPTATTTGAGLPPPPSEATPPSAATPAPTGAAPREGGPAAQAAASPGILDGAAVDVRVDVPNTLILRGNGVKLGGEGLSLGDLNMTLGGDLRATKSPGGEPLVVGSIHTVRGFYEFQGRRFELQRDGTVAFKGPDPANPQLDVTATRDISGVEARVRVHGQAQRPELELTSAPPLDEGDILSLIIFNRPINDLGEGEKTTLASRAGSLVGGFVAAPVAEALRDALDVDQLEITPVSENGGGASVSVGNQIGERVYVKVRQQFGSSESTQLVLEYELSKQLRLQTSMAQGGDTSRTIGRRAERGGADLVFVVKY